MSKVTRCAACGAEFTRKPGRGRPRTKCTGCSPVDTRRRYVLQPRLAKTCKECGADFSGTAAKKFCSDTCRNRHKDKKKVIPCAACGEPMCYGSTSRTEGQARHNGCGNYWPNGDLIHCAEAYRKHRCRCEECWLYFQHKINTYNARPEVRARLRASSQKLKAARLEAPALAYTAGQLVARMSMFDGCWICQRPLGEDYHVDHVKPLSRGGWDCLANLRPAHPFCNISKNDKWPFDPAPYRRDPDHLPAA